MVLPVAALVARNPECLPGCLSIPVTIVTSDGPTPVHCDGIAPDPHDPLAILVRRWEWNFKLEDLPEGEPPDILRASLRDPKVQHHLGEHLVGLLGSKDGDRLKIGQPLTDLQKRAFQEAMAGAPGQEFWALVRDKDAPASSGGREADGWGLERVKFDEF